jgi:hypothetical protein
VELWPPAAEPPSASPHGPYPAQQQVAGSGRSPAARDFREPAPSGVQVAEFAQLAIPPRLPSTLSPGKNQEKPALATYPRDSPPARPALRESHPRTAESPRSREFRRQRFAPGSLRTRRKPPFCTKMRPLCRGLGLAVGGHAPKATLGTSNVLKVALGACGPAPCVTTASAVSEAGTFPDLCPAGARSLPRRTAASRRQPHRTPWLHIHLRPGFGRPPPAAITDPRIHHKSHKSASCGASVGRWRCRGSTGHIVCPSGKTDAGSGATPLARQEYP